jgi:hypothetical protein
VESGCKSNTEIRKAVAAENKIGIFSFVFVKENFACFPLLLCGILQLILAIRLYEGFRTNNGAARIAGYA